jgi:hypothetical protein
MKFWRGAGMLFVVLSAGSAFGTLDPCWMFKDTSGLMFNNFRFCDTIRNGDLACKEESAGYPDTDSYDSSQYLNFDYQFTQDSVYVVQTYYPCVDPQDTCPDDTTNRIAPRPGYAGFKTAWDVGMVGFYLARYKYLIMAHKGPVSTHKVTIRFWYNDGKCGSDSYNDFIGTLAASSTWILDTIPIPESIQNKPDDFRNKMLYYEMVVLINNLDPNDTTSSPPENLKIDNIRLAGCNPIDSSPKSQTVIEGQPVTFCVATSRADSADILTYQWKKDGVDIAGEDSSVYTLASVKAADAGVYTVAVTVSSTNLSFTSSGATLTLNVPEEKKNCGCGAGTGMALIPPLFFKAMAHRKRKKRNTRINAVVNSL